MIDITNSSKITSWKLRALLSKGLDRLFHIKTNTQEIEKRIFWTIP